MRQVRTIILSELAVGTSASTVYSRYVPMLIEKTKDTKEIGTQLDRLIFDIFVFFLLKHTTSNISHSNRTRY